MAASCNTCSASWLRRNCQHMSHSSGQYSTPRIHQAVIDEIRHINADLEGSHLDIGSGDGSLIQLLQRHFALKSCACDYTDALMELPGQAVDVVDLDYNILPYPDGSFNLITFTEVIEHLENHRHALREIHRVLKPGGIVIVTTPNILNLKSRLRFLFFGFWNLFGPLHVLASEKYSTGGHINPISYFYLCHSLYDTGLEPVHNGIDQIQRSSIPALLLLWLPIKLLGRRALSRETRKYGTVDAYNRDIVLAMNRSTMLLGRTIVITARRPRMPQDAQ